jgi:hypothetical protein
MKIVATPVLADRRLVVEVDPDLAKFIREMCLHNGLAIKKYTNALLETAIKEERERADSIALQYVIKAP